MLNNDLPDHAWLTKSKSDFNESRRTKVPSMNGASISGSGKATIAEGDVDADAVTQFQKSIRMDVSSYPVFNDRSDNTELWLPFKHKLKAVMTTHGIQRIIQDEDTVIRPGTQDSKLYDKQNGFYITSSQLI